MLKVVIMTLGSAGDLHPYLAIARGLREAGVDVLLASQASHEAEVQAQGVPFAPIASAADEARTLTHPDLWHPLRGLGVLWRHLVVPSIEPSTTLLQQLAARHASQLHVLASPLAVGARLAADAWPELRLTMAHTAPTSLRSCANPMWLGNHKVPDWLPVWSRSWLWSALDHWKLDPMARPALNRWRRRQGLASIKGSVFGHWLLDSKAGQHIALWPPEFAAPAPGWPAELTLVGFPMYDANLQTEQGSAADVVLYPGSAPTPALAAMQNAAQDLAQAGISYRLLVPGTPRENLPSLLSSARVFVHHGGIGAIAQGLRAGVHQRVLATAYDQAPNAGRLQHALGCPRTSDATHLVKDILTDLGLPKPKPWPLSLSQPGTPNASVQHVIQHLVMIETPK